MEWLAVAEEHFSYYHILSKPAHITLAHASLSVLLHLDNTIGRDTMCGRPNNLLPLLTHMAIRHVKESLLSLRTTIPLHVFLIFWRPFFFTSTININLTSFFSLKGWHMYMWLLTHTWSHVWSHSCTWYTHTWLNAQGNQIWLSLQHYRPWPIGVLSLHCCFWSSPPRWWQWRAIRCGDVSDLMADPTLTEEELGFHSKKDLTTVRWRTGLRLHYTILVLDLLLTPLSLFW